MHGWESPETDEEEVWEGHGVNCGELRCTCCADNGCGFDKHLCRVLLNRLTEEVVRQTALEIARQAPHMPVQKTRRCGRANSGAREILGAGLSTLTIAIKLQPHVMSRPKEPLQSSMLSFVQVGPKPRKSGRKRKQKNGNAGRKKKAKAKASPKTAPELAAEAEKFHQLQQKNQKEATKVKSKRLTCLPGTAERGIVEEALASWPLKKRREASMANHIRDTCVPNGVPCSSAVGFLTGKRELSFVQHRDRKALLSEDQQQVIIDTTASADMGDEGLTRGTAIKLITELNPEVTSQQARRHYENTVLKKGKKQGTLTGTVSAQSTSSMRSMCTARQQRRWHAIVDTTRKQIADLNVDDGTGVRYTDAEDSFVLNADEECLRAEPNGGFKVVGAHGRSKHQRESAGRPTCTMLKVVVSSGINGPCFFLMAGTKRLAEKKGFTSACGQHQLCLVCVCLAIVATCAKMVRRAEFSFTEAPVRRRRRGGR